MNLLAILENGLFALGQVLRLPVMALLWVCVICVLFMVGACIMDFLTRRRERVGFNVKTWILDGQLLNSDDSRIQLLPSPLRHFIKDVKANHKDSDFRDGDLAHLLLQHEERVRDTQRGSRTLVKVGPSLGLLGTLIPMGTSLAAMAAGNLEAMASQMVVAFTTTIVGIAVGTVSYIILVVRQAWITETVREQRYLAERIAAELENGGE